MKKIIDSLLFALLLLSSCNEYEMVQYEEGGQINFLADAAWATDYTGKGPVWSESATLLYKFNFGINEQGENLMYDTVMLAVKIMGDVVAHPRRVALAVKPSSTDTFGIIFPEEEGYVVKADTFAATFAIVIKRPALQVSDTAVLTFDYANSDFTRGFEERQEVKLIIEDIVTEKLWQYDEALWNNYEKYLGGFGEVKARYLMTQYGCVSFEKWVSKITALGKANRFYLDLEEYKAKCAEDDSMPKFIDKDTGEWIAFPDQAS